MLIVCVTNLVYNEKCLTVSKVCEMANLVPEGSGKSHQYNEIHRFFEFSLDLFAISGFDGYLKRVNPAWERTLGYTAEELLSRPALEFIHPDDRVTSLSQRQHTHSGSSIINFENRYICKDGSIKWMQWTAHPYPEDGLNYVVGRDVTERKLAQDLLHQSQEAMRGLLNGMPSRALLLAPDGTILMANDLQAAGFGVSPEALIGKNFYDLIPEDTEARQQRRNSINRVMTSGKPLIVEVERDGYYFETTITPIHSETGEVTSIVISGHDITQLKQLEQERLDNQRLQMEVKQERELIQLRQQFMSMVSHEFRTPLTVIASSTEILQHYDDRLSRERRMEKLQVINGQVRMMVTLLDDILALNRIQAGVSDFTPEALDLLTLCISVLNNVKIMDQNQHHFIFDNQTDSAQILADRRLLEHSITNLLANAVKYSPPETCIRLSLLSTGNSVHVEVGDQGIGIPVEDQAHLFEPFYRATNARKIDGTGLGLAIVKHNVEQHGGTITCRSAEGEGTTFSIQLPTSQGT
jgi:PAS domain S-box-containing protein